MAASHLEFYLLILTLTVIITPCEGMDAGVIAGVTVGAVVVVAVIVGILLYLLIRRKRRLGQSSLRHKSSVCENVSPNGIINSVRKSGGYPTTAPQEIRRETQPAKTQMIQKPEIKKKPPHLAKRGNVKENNGCEKRDNNNSTVIPVAGLGEHINRVKAREKGFDTEYQQLPSGFKWSYNESQKEENKGKNKFTGYYPYDYNRVVLASTPGDTSSTYINASFITGYKEKKFYIAAQAPKKKTLEDFWRMIWEQKCGKIVMLTNLVEAMRVKCEPYWDAESPVHVGIFVVTVTKETTRAHWTVRELTVKHRETRLTKSVLQFHFTSWPDHGVPEVTSLAEFVWRVRKTRSPQSGPQLVHCSAGIGRTGAYLAIDYLLDQGAAEKEVDVFGFVSTMRDQRKDMIQTMEQYECVYNVLREAFSMGDTVLTCQEFRNLRESDKTFSMGNCSLSEFSKILNTEKHVPRHDDEPCRLWITGKGDHFAVYVPSYRSMNGYIVCELPSKSDTESFWKMVDDQDSDVVILLPDASKHLSKLSPSCGKSSDFDGFSVCCKSQETVDKTAVCRQLQITAKNDSSTSTNVRLFSSNTLAMKDIPQRMTQVINTRDSESDPRPTTLIFGPKERKLAAIFCVVSTAMEGIALDEEIEIYNKVRTTARLLQQELTESDMQTLIETIALHVPSASMYANFSCA